MKPVNEESFWRKRIERAKEGREHYSVYITSDKDWSYLNSVHEELLKKECTGRVLDAGCGYGRLSVLFDDYVGVDFSKDFIEIAKSKYSDKTFVQAKLENLPFKDNEFDSAFCVSVKEMIIANRGGEAWEKMEKELKRVAKKLVIFEYTDPEKYEVL